MKSSTERMRRSDRSHETGDPVSDLRNAVDERRWSDAVRIISARWTMFVEEFPAELDFALQLVPTEAFREFPGAAAVREIWRWTSIEPQHIVPAEIPSDALEYVSDGGAWMGAHPLLRELTHEAANMVAARMGGRLEDALAHAHRVEEIGRSVEDSVPVARQMRYPLALLHVGITRGVSGDIPGALPVLQNAYERTPYGLSEYVAKAASGNLALFHALSGDIDIAIRWLARHDELPSSESPHTERVLFTGDLARSLIAVESLDRKTTEDSLARLDQGVNVEQSWGPVVTYVHARHGFVWGDRTRALAWVRRDRERYTAWLGPHSTMGPLLAAAEVDLLLSLKQGDQALACLNRTSENPVLQVARARLELFAGATEEGGRLAAETLSVASTSRVRLEAMVVQAVALSRCDKSDAACEMYRMADDASMATGGRIALVAMADAVRDEFERLSTETASDAGPVELPDRPLFAGTVTLIRLTNQELLTLRGLANYGSQKELADATFLSVSTVKTHLRAAYQKLGASSRTQALTIAGLAGLL